MQSEPDLLDARVEPEHDGEEGGAQPAARVNKSKNETHERLLFSEKFACPVSGFTISEIEPRLFSFNNPFGACPECDGLGTKQAIDPELIVPDEAMTLKAGAIAPWSKTSSPYYLQTLEGLARHFRLQGHRPLAGSRRAREAGDPLRHRRGEGRLHL